jgi:hypothetical protein
MPSSSVRRTGPSSLTDDARAAVRRRVVLLGLALALAVASAAKPLHIDDPFFYRVAARIAVAPFDPYGFDILWHQWPQPVHEELTPPVAPYWQALGLRVAGDRPVLWKLWQLPFAAVFVVSLHAILRRWAPRVALPVTALTALSPTFLPALNLMQDVPAAALGLASVATYLRADASDRARWAVAAGLVAGLAAQTKYSALTFAAALALHGLLHGKLRLGILAASAAAIPFCGWEWAMTVRYGQGMLFGQLGTDWYWTGRGAMAGFLLHLAGGTLSVPGWIAVAARAPRASAWGGAAVVAAVASIAWRPVEHLVFLALGVMATTLVGFAVVRAVALSRGAAGELRTTLFLCGWLALEMAGYFATAPFPAVRRVVGIVLVATLLAARVASLELARAAAPADRGPRRLAALVAASALLGVLVSWVDVREARAFPEAVRAARDAIRAAGGGTVWFVGHWGFHHYAPRAGMRPLVPDHTFVRAGDWIVVPSRADAPELTADPAILSLSSVLDVEDALPLETSFDYYAGSSIVGHLTGARMRMGLFRAVRDGIVPSGWTIDEVARFARSAGGESASWAVPALVQGLAHPHPGARLLGATVLGEIGPRALGAGTRLAAAATDDPEPGVRVAAVRALGRIGRRSQAVLDALERARHDSDPRVREAAGDALAHLVPPEAPPAS